MSEYTFTVNPDFGIWTGLFDSSASVFYDKYSGGWWGSLADDPEFTSLAGPDVYTITVSYPGDIVSWNYANGAQYSGGALAPGAWSFFDGSAVVGSSTNTVSSIVGTVTGALQGAFDGLISVLVLILVVSSIFVLVGRMLKGRLRLR